MGSYPTLFTITLSGSIVSVVLSLSLRTVAVSDYLALCCPDFPLVRQAVVFQARTDYITGRIKNEEKIHNIQLKTSMIPYNGITFIYS